MHRKIELQLEQIKRYLLRSAEYNSRASRKFSYCKILAISRLLVYLICSVLMLAISPGELVTADTFREKDFSVDNLPGPRLVLHTTRTEVRQLLIPAYLPLRVAKSIAWAPYLIVPVSSLLHKVLMVWSIPEHEHTGTPSPLLSLSAEDRRIFHGHSQLK